MEDASWNRAWVRLDKANMKYDRPDQIDQTSDTTECKIVGRIPGLTDPLRIRRPSSKKERERCSGHVQLVAINEKSPWSIEELKILRIPIAPAKKNKEDDESREKWNRWDAESPNFKFARFSAPELSQGGGWVISVCYYWIWFSIWDFNRSNH